MLSDIGYRRNRISVHLGTWRATIKSPRPRLGYRFSTDGQPTVVHGPAVIASFYIGQGLPIDAKASPAFSGPVIFHSIPLTLSNLGNLPVHEASTTSFNHGQIITYPHQCGVSILCSLEVVISSPGGGVERLFIPPQFAGSRFTGSGFFVVTGCGGCPWEGRSEQNIRSRGIMPQQHREG